MQMVDLNTNFTSTRRPSFLQLCSKPSISAHVLRCLCHIPVRELFDFWVPCLFASFHERFVCDVELICEQCNLSLDLLPCGTSLDAATTCWVLSAVVWLVFCFFLSFIFFNVNMAVFAWKFIFWTCYFRSWAYIVLYIILVVIERSINCFRGSLSPIASKTESYVFNVVGQTVTSACMKDICVANLLPLNRIDWYNTVFAEDLNLAKNVNLDFILGVNVGAIGELQSRISRSSLASTNLQLMHEVIF